MTTARRVLLAAALALLVVGAGCGGSTGTTTAPTDDTTTTTEPTATTTTTTTPDGETLPGGVAAPPGMNESGVINLSRLLAANRRQLLSGNYATLFRYDAEGPNASTFLLSRINSSLDRAVEHSYSERRVTQRGRTTLIVRDQYVDGRERVERVNNSGKVGFRTLESQPFNATRRALIQRLSEAIGQVIGASEYEFARVIERDGRRLVEYRLVSYSQRGATINSTSGRLVVAPDGTIHSLRLELRGIRSRGSDITRSTTVYRLRATGDVVVVKPDWVEEARGNARLAPPGRSR